MSSQPIIDQFLRDHESGAYFARLINQPSPHRRRRTPEPVYHARLHPHQPRFTIVTPMFNNAPTIEAYMHATVRAASLPFDWILVDDGSDDRTAERAASIFDSVRPSLVAAATIVRNPVPIFETACDNIGFTLAQTPVVVEVQSDIQILEDAFDALLLRVLSATPRPAAISGRCGHSFFHLRGRFARALLGGRDAECIGLCGALIETPQVAAALEGRVYRCETVPRGPWVVLKSDLQRLGYLDERFFFLGNDDHDYHRRLFEADRRRPVYVPLSLYAPLRLGAQRRARHGVNREVFEDLKATRRGSPAFRRFLTAQRRPALPERIV